MIAALLGQHERFGDGEPYAHVRGDARRFAGFAIAAGIGVVLGIVGAGRWRATSGFGAVCGTGCCGRHLGGQRALQAVQRRASRDVAQVARRAAKCTKT
jgi:hypothetical protein